MKKLARDFITAILWWQVHRLQKKNNIKVIAVAGSVGKTSTKMAVANILSTNFGVRYQQGNYNVPLSVPFIFFGGNLPNLLNPLAWLAVFVRNEIKLLKRYPYAVVIVELGTDGPGQIAEFKNYLQAEISVLTAIAPEHMEYFGSLDAVAAEETAIADLSTLTLINKDMCDPKYTDKISQSLTYAINANADFKLTNIKFDDDGCSFDVQAAGKKIFSASHEAFTEPQLYAILAAIAVAHKMGLDNDQIHKGLSKIQPVAGRMQKLAGVNGSTIIDDTYNASPEAVTAALKTLYRLPAPQKIAILGNMNELGEYSKSAHEQIGKQCDPKQINLVVTIGPDANKYLAPAAKSKGCNVQTFDNPYDAGEFVKNQIQPGALILAKGSQNKVFAEEAVKLLLANPDDSAKLVRQSRYWQKRKAKSFK